MTEDNKELEEMLRQYDCMIYDLNETVERINKVIQEEKLKALAEVEKIIKDYNCLWKHNTPLREKYQRFLDLIKDELLEELQKLKEKKENDL